MKVLLFLTILLASFVFADKEHESNHECCDKDQTEQIKTAQEHSEEDCDCGDFCRGSCSNCECCTAGLVFSAISSDFCDNQPHQFAPSEKIYTPETFHPDKNSESLFRPPIDNV